MHVCVCAMGGDFLIFMHLCALWRRGKFSPTGIQSVFYWPFVRCKVLAPVSLLSSVQLRAIKDKTVHCFRTVMAMVGIFHEKKMFFTHAE